ncbi:MAG: uL30 family ribosomal protein [Nanoarchaeota archaeon]|nr:uL30 family ribosomal protein [Nanoarchaeota archaeon]
MILIIRIAGQVDVPGDVKEALFRLRIRKKYSAVLIKPTPESLKLIKKIRNYIAYGPINKETLLELIEKRAKPVKKGIKIDAAKIAEQIDKKTLEELKVKPFFSLHPPRGGIDAKIHAGRKKGVLGDNKEKINDLVRRML